MSEATVRAAIKTVVDAVTDSGTVYDYIPYASVTNEYLTLFQTTISGNEVIRAWTITLESIPVEGWVATGARSSGNKWPLNYRLRYYHGLDQANSSESAAVAIVIAVIKALNSAASLEQFSNEIAPNRAAVLETFQLLPFGSVLCHYAEVTQTINMTDSGV